MIRQFFATLAIANAIFLNACSTHVETSSWPKLSPGLISAYESLSVPGYPKYALVPTGTFLRTYSLCDPHFTPQLHPNGPRVYRSDSERLLSDRTWPTTMTAMALIHAYCNRKLDTLAWYTADSKPSPIPGSESWPTLAVGSTFVVTAPGLQQIALAPMEVVKVYNACDLVVRASASRWLAEHRPDFNTNAFWTACDNNGSNQRPY